MRSKQESKPSAPGLYDNKALKRRELWFAWEGELIQYGWCHRDALVTASALWKPHEAFGKFLDIG